mmetsp:Transcript_4976/g.7354  ORF Transcript_4976/g.7354 Transcript_4976/m.7354 type:complete len:223 (-) Transcript_4976:99-767(-)|eukprot:CAMPEP_0172430192 /NCGR_PEP_ID=MMETSP1064-20121228/53525_1 /TAXON_ID=202472 /ORGANISM="Aulacoseira subarctica , Strain CCAP 1002/5" /LENGTH=222 /DNA_ID=CAMNT_0013176091 /DNA_START=155 /DNA_END=823 /DNA_ORIENTATION=+
MTMIQHLCFRRQAPTYQKILLVQRSHYFTNGDRVKGDDPYVVLGLTWGATNTEIKEAYHKLAREHHPDVSKASLEKFQKIQHAYSSLMDVKIFRFSSSKEKLEQYSFQTWRLGDAIAQQRTDVAGAARKRPKPPAAVAEGKNVASRYTLGQPDGSGVRNRQNADYLTSGSLDKAEKNTGTVGTGRNKWITPPPWKPWNPSERPTTPRRTLPLDMDASSESKS